MTFLRLLGCVVSGRWKAGWTDSHPLGRWALASSWTINPIEAMWSGVTRVATTFTK